MSKTAGSIIAAAQFSRALFKKKLHPECVFCHQGPSHETRVAPHLSTSINMSSVRPRKKQRCKSPRGKVKTKSKAAIKVKATKLLSDEPIVMATVMSQYRSTTG